MTIFMTSAYLTFSMYHILNNCFPWALWYRLVVLAMWKLRQEYHKPKVCLVYEWTQGEPGQPIETLYQNLKTNSKEDWRLSSWVENLPSSSPQNNSFNLFYLFKCVSVLTTYTSAHHVHAWYLWKPKEAPLGLGLHVLVSNLWCWESNPGPLKKKPVITTETFLQPCVKIFKWLLCSSNRGNSVLWHRCFLSGCVSACPPRLSTPAADIYFFNFLASGNQPTSLSSFKFNSSKDERQPK